MTMFIIHFEGAPWIIEYVQDGVIYLAWPHDTLPANFHSSVRLTELQ